MKLHGTTPEGVSLNILVTSDIGLAGGYNSNVFRILKENAKASDQYVIIGNKGLATAKARDYKIIGEYPNAGDEPDYLIASQIGKEALAKFFAGEVNEVNIIHTKFINSVTFEAVKTKLLPIEPEENPESKGESAVKIMAEFEPSAEKVIKNALPLYVSALVFGSMVESKVSEMSSRRTAMENATDNAEELIYALDLQYNRARQAAITQEITEIVAGSDS